MDNQELNDQECKYDLISELLIDENPNPRGGIGAELKQSKVSIEALQIKSILQANSKYEKHHGIEQPHEEEVRPEAVAQRNNVGLHSFQELEKVSFRMHHVPRESTWHGWRFNFQLFKSIGMSHRTDESSVEIIQV